MSQFVCKPKVQFSIGNLPKIASLHISQSEKKFLLTSKHVAKAAKLLPIL